MSNKSYLAAHPEATFDYIATAALVLSSEAGDEPRVLLLQRAASDSNPNRWEPPGGGCDDEDETILHGAARELWEEAGLQASRIDGPIGDHCFTSRSGKRICQFNFVVPAVVGSRAPPDVKLDPKEHQQFIWATNDEIIAMNSNGMELDFTSEEVQRIVLLAFDYFRKN